MRGAESCYLFASIYVEYVVGIPNDNFGCAWMGDEVIRTFETTATTSEGLL